MGDSKLAGLTVLLTSFGLVLAALGSGLALLITLVLDAVKKAKVGT